MRIQNAAWFPNADERFDLALNADSLTEMGADQMDRYWAEVRRHTSVFLSINQEALSVRVADLPDRSGTTVKTLPPAWTNRSGVLAHVRTVPVIPVMTTTSAIDPEPIWMAAAVP